MIKISNLTKAYGKKLALDDVSFTVGDGEILGFLGPNGAGKSTTMNIITGYISSTSGSVEVDGYNILENPIEVKKRIGYLPELPPLYPDMLVYDYLDFVYELKKVKTENKKEHIHNIINEVGIDGVAKRRIGNLSKGYKQRVGLASALIGNPQVLILDEPTVGLDPKQIIEIRNLIKSLGEKRTVILSSHILSEISAVCERVIIINNGKLVAEDTPQHLSERFGRNNKLMIRVSGAEDAIENVLRGLEGVVEVTASGQADENSYDFIIETSIEIDNEFNKKLFFAFAENAMPIVMQKKVEDSLEDIFLQVTADDVSADDIVEEAADDAASEIIAEEGENDESDIQQGA
ncbi:MAG: ATP-binding cassette domain-containing protein [Clostridia bacterium]|nr:ATP-binding cassette domain-containing protein [Clostridia bacterium]